MVKLRRIAALLGALAVVGMSVSITWGTAAAKVADEAAVADQPSPADERIVVLGKQTRFKVVDLGRRGESLGDTMLIREVLLDDNGDKVGRGTFRCMLQHKPDLQCDGAYVFPGRGKIAFANLVDTSQFDDAGEAPPIVAPIVGGDGDFAHVTGQLILEFQGEDNLTTFELRYLN